MADFNLDKKKEHERLAEQALRAKDYVKAQYHVMEAARYAFVLADRCEGVLRTAYESNGNDLVSIAEELKARAECKSGAAMGESSSSCRLGERPSVRLADVAGMEKVKEQIRLRLMEPLRNADEAKKYGLKIGGGILLYGPPGTGKTFVAKAVAGELNLPFYTITSADVFGKYVGESENNIRTLFREARKNPLSVIFIDELETIFRRRTDSVHETTQKVITVILQELDGIAEQRNPILLLGATNTPWMIDEAFMRTGRFDVLAYVGLPEVAARRLILANAFKGAAIPVGEEALNWASERTEGFSGADLKGVAEKVKQLAFDAHADRYDESLFARALEGCFPSCKEETNARIAEWEQANEIRRD